MSVRTVLLVRCRIREILNVTLNAWKKKRRLEREEKNMGEFKRWNIDGMKQRRIAFEKKIDASGRINSPLQIHY